MRDDANNCDLSDTHSTHGKIAAFILVILHGFHTGLRRPASLGPVRDTRQNRKASNDKLPRCLARGTDVILPERATSGYVLLYIIPHLRVLFTLIFGCFALYCETLSRGLCGCVQGRPARQAKSRFALLALSERNLSKGGVPRGVPACREKCARTGTRLSAFSAIPPAPPAIGTRSARKCGGRARKSTRGEPHGTIGVSPY